MRSPIATVLVIAFMLSTVVYVLTIVANGLAAVVGGVAL